MKTSTRNKLRRLLCAVVFCALSGGMCVGAAEAKVDTGWLKKGVDISEKQVLYMDPAEDPESNALTECLYPLSKNISAKKIRDVKSGNPKVLKAGRAYNEQAGAKKAVVLELFPLKTGKATVSFKYKSRTYKIQYVVKKFNNGIKSLRLGGISKDFASKFNSARSFGQEITKKPAKLRVKMKKNWVVKEIDVHSYKKDMAFRRTVFSSNRGKNSVTIKKSDLKFSTFMVVEMECENKKTGEEETYVLSLERSR